MKTIFAGSLGVGLLLFTLFMAGAQEHSGHGPMPADQHWYPSECCYGDEAGGDCREVSCGQLKDTRKGVVYTMKDGTKITFPAANLYASPNNKCHACFSEWGITNSDTGEYKTGFTPYCVFQPPPKGL